MAKAKLEYRLRADGKYDFHLIASNGEELMNGSQGYDKKNLKRAAAALKRSMGAAVFCEGPATEGSGGPGEEGPGGP